MDSFYVDKVKSLEKTSELVRTIKKLVDAINSSLSENDFLTKNCTDKTVDDKPVGAEQRHQKLVNELCNLNEKVESSKIKVNGVRYEYEDALHVNKSLKDEVSELNRKESEEDRQKIADECRRKLKLFKKLTAIRFDFNKPDDVIMGFAAVDGKTQGNSIAPFMIEKNDSNVTEILWDKIKEAANAKDDPEFLHIRFENSLQLH